MSPLWRPLAALLLLVAPAYGLDLADLEPVPAANLDQVEPAIVEQLEALHADLDAALGATPLDPEVLLLAYEELGQTCLAYSLLEPGVVALENASLLAPEDFRWPYLLARVAQETNDPERAGELLTRVLELNPDYLPAIIRFGELELTRQRLDEARTWYGKALELAPGSPAANYGLAQIAMSEDRPQDAVTHFEEVLEAQPSANAVHYALGLAYRDLGNRDKAREHLAQRGEVGVQPYDPLADALANRVKGASLYITRGNLALLAGNYDLAIQAYGKAVAATPDNSVALQGLANSYGRAGRIDEAIALYSEILEATPGDSLILYNLGTLLSDVGREDEARAALERALEITPELTDARFNLALLHERRGAWEAALEQYTTLLAQEPEDLDAAVRHAAAAARLGQMNEARAELAAVLESDPRRGNAYIELARTYELEGDAAGAERVYREAIARAPETDTRARAAFALGKLLERSHPAAAIEAFEIAREAAPGIAAAHLSLAVVLGREGRFAEAAAAYDAGLSLEPGEPQTHVGRAMAHLLAGQEARALIALEQSIDGPADSMALRHLLARLLATSSNAAVRDGQRAVALAQDVMQRQPSLDHGETLAMALAETGRFEEAAAMQEQVRQRAVAIGRTEVLRSIEERLDGYLAGRAVRSPWNR